MSILEAQGLSNQELDQNPESCTLVWNLYWTLCAVVVAPP